MEDQNLHEILTKSGKILAMPDELVVKKIYLIRGQKIMLNRDLAELYGVETKALNQAVKRNAGRFPYDFMFQLTAIEFENLKSQFVTSSWGGVREAWYSKLRYRLKRYFNGKTKQRIDNT